MPGQTSSLKIPYPNGGDSPDGPGGIQALAEFLETDTFVQGGWAPGYGGDSGATTGANGGTNGFFWKVGRIVSYRGRILFGSSAIAGGGVITGFNIGSADGNFSGGRGVYIPPTGAPVDLVLRPTSLSEWAISVVRDGYLAPFNSLGNPPQSAQIFFDGSSVVAAHA